MSTDYATKAAEEWCGSDARHSATVKEIAAIIRKHAARTTDPRAARIAELEAALQAAISFLEDDSRSPRRRAACLESFRQSLNSNVNSDKETK